MKLMKEIPAFSEWNRFLTHTVQMKLLAPVAFSVILFEFLTHTVQMKHRAGTITYLVPPSS